MTETTVPAQGNPLWIHAGTLHLMAAAAWMSILLGIVVECAVLMTRAVAGVAPNLIQAVAEFASSVTWAVIVCTGISLGSAAARHRERIMGLMGLLCAPLAWALAKGVQHGTLSMLDAPVDKLGAAVVQVGALKTVEYTLLAIAVAKLIRRQSTLAQHVLVGLAIGVVFGAAIVGVNVWHAPGRVLPLARLMGLAVNEIVFPMGCVAVLHFISRLNELAADAKLRTAPEPGSLAQDHDGVHTP
jgi:hypothetical protein